MSAVPSPGRLLKLAAAVLAGLLYVWFAAVRAVPKVKQRRAAQRAARRFGS